MLVITVKLLNYVPPDYGCFSLPRVGRWGGGLVIVFKKHFKCNLLPCNALSSFELLLFKLRGSLPVTFAVIYHPPKASGSFLTEFSEFLAHFILSSDRIILCGDFNIHVNDSSDALTKDFF